MNDQQQLGFDEYKLARRGDPDTSHQAAQLLAGKAGTMRRRLLVAFFTSTGLTAEEAAQAAGYGPADGAWKRVSDLKNARLIGPMGKTRPGRSGREQQVLGITDLGWEALGGGEGFREG